MSRRHRDVQVDPVALVKNEVDNARVRGKSVLLVELGDAKFVPKWELVEEPGSDDEARRKKPVSLLFVSPEILKALYPLVKADPRVKFFAKFLRGGGGPRPTSPGGSRVSQVA